MRVTIDDIARLANVSKTTVSRVINEQPEGVGPATRARVLKIIDEYDYRPNLLARGVVTSKTRTLGFIIPDITNPFFPELFKSVEDYAAEQGYTVILCNTDSSFEKEEKAISTLIAKRVDGVLLSSMIGNQQSIQERFEKYNIPCVLLDRCTDQPGHGAGVYIDNEYALFIATKHLIVNGNREIAFISGPDSLPTSKERLEGYRGALSAYHIPFHTNLMISGSFSMESGYRAITQLIQQKTAFTAVLAGNDMIAIGALKALKDLGLSVPEQVEVIGFDNIRLSGMTEPALTTISQPIHRLGREAVKILISLTGGQQPMLKSIKLEPRLILRDSTKNRYPQKAYGDIAV